MLPYFPSLRAKPGELAACAGLSARYREHVIPRFIIPPKVERDQDLGRPPNADELSWYFGDRIGRLWPSGPAFVDPQFVIDDIGIVGALRLFQVAQGRNARLVPMLTQEMLGEAAFCGLRAAGDFDLGICVDYEGVDPAILTAGLRDLGVRADRCALFVDFTEAPLSEDIAAPVASILDLASSTAGWRRVVYAASAYPPALPVQANKQTLLPRSEWSVFLSALEECSAGPARLAYGDYGADTGQIVFPKSGGGRPKPHLRYTTRAETLVVRGPDSGTHTSAMRAVCRTIVDSGRFAGRRCSYADDLIWRYARNISDGCGDASHWRELNTAHHIAQVVRDLGAMVGKSFADDEVHDFGEQLTLLTD